jgi:hypothetical protein
MSSDHDPNCPVSFSLKSFSTFFPAKLRYRRSYATAKTMVWRTMVWRTIVWRTLGVGGRWVTQVWRTPIWIRLAVAYAGFSL